jgi:amylosucrase
MQPRVPVLNCAAAPIDRDLICRNIKSQRSCSEFYSGNFPGSFAKGALFQSDPVSQDARICGTTASLAGLEQAMANQDDREIDLAVRRILLLHSVIMVYGGIPLIYMGDELGLFSDRTYLTDPIKAPDNRWMQRMAMDWTKAASRHDPHTIAGQIYGYQIF